MLQQKAIASTIAGSKVEGMKCALAAMEFPKWFLKITLIPVPTDSRIEASKFALILSLKGGSQRGGDA